MRQCLESYETPDATNAAVLAAYGWLTPEQVATARAYCLANQLPFMRGASSTTTPPM